MTSLREPYVIGIDYSGHFYSSQTTSCLPDIILVIVEIHTPPQALASNQDLKNHELDVSSSDDGGFLVLCTNSKHQAMVRFSDRVPPLTERRACFVCVLNLRIPPESLENLLLLIEALVIPA